MQQMTIKEIIKKNPKIDEKKLKESMELSDKLRSHGISARGYSLVLPFAGKKVQAVDSKEDKRTIHLTRS
jgi:exonuclease VII large subunit